MSPTGQAIIRELKKPNVAQQTIVELYAMAIREDQRGIVVGWPEVNSAIRGKWSYDTQCRIRSQAWAQIGD